MRGEKVGLTGRILDDAQALEMGAKYIKALIPAVVNIVYKKLLSYDVCT